MNDAEKKKQENEKAQNELKSMMSKYHTNLEERMNERKIYLRTGKMTERIQKELESAGQEIQDILEYIKNFCEEQGLHGELIAEEHGIHLSELNVDLYLEYTPSIQGTDYDVKLIMESPDWDHDLTLRYDNIELNICLEMDICRCYLTALIKQYKAEYFTTLETEFEEKNHRWMITHGQLYNFEKMHDKKKWAKLDEMFHRLCQSIEPGKEHNYFDEVYDLAVTRNMIANLKDRLGNQKIAVIEIVKHHKYGELCFLNGEYDYHMTRSFYPKFLTKAFANFGDKDVRIGQYIQKQVFVLIQDPGTVLPYPHSQESLEEYTKAAMQIFVSKPLQEVAPEILKVCGDTSLMHELIGYLPIIATEHAVLWSPVSPLCISDQQKIWASHMAPDWGIIGDFPSPSSKGAVSGMVDAVLASPNAKMSSVYSEGVVQFYLEDSCCTAYRKGVAPSHLIYNWYRKNKAQLMRGNPLLVSQILSFNQGGQEKVVFRSKLASYRVIEETFYWAIKNKIFGEETERVYQTLIRYGRMYAEAMGGNPSKNYVEITIPSGADFELR